MQSSTESVGTSAMQQKEMGFLWGSMQQNRRLLSSQMAPTLDQHFSTVRRGSNGKLIKGKLNNQFERRQKREYVIASFGQEASTLI